MFAYYLFPNFKANIFSTFSIWHGSSVFRVISEAEKIKSVCFVKSQIFERKKERIKKNKRDNKILYIIAAHHNAAASELFNKKRLCVCNNIAVFQSL